MKYPTDPPHTNNCQRGKDKHKTGKNWMKTQKNEEAKYVGHK